MALQSQPSGLRFRGSARLVHKPSDVDETYLTRREVEEVSLPNWVRENRATRVTVLEQQHQVVDAPAPGTLTSALGTIAAYSLADESWDWPPTAVSTPQMAFDRGHQFLGATLDVNEYSLLRWATFAPAAGLHVWKVEPASKDQEKAALIEVQQLPSYRARQAEYRVFAARVEAVASQVNKLRSQDPKARERLEWFKSEALPETWELSKVRGAWVIGGVWAPNILVAFFEQGDAQVVPTRGGSGAERAEIRFEGTIVAVWALAEKLELLGEVAPRQGSGEGLSHFQIHGALGSESGLPALLFTADGVTGSLRPVGGRYAFDDEHTLRVSVPHAAATERTGGPQPQRD